MVEESDKRRKQDKEKAAEASREYKRVSIMLFRSYRRSNPHMRKGFVSCRAKIRTTIVRLRRFKTIDLMFFKTLYMENSVASLDHLKK